MESFFSRPVEDRNGVIHVYPLMQSSWEELLQSGCDLKDLVDLLQRVDVAWLSRDDYVYLKGDGCLSPLMDDEEEGVAQVHHTHHIRLDTSDNFRSTVCLASVTPEEPVQVYRQLFQLLARQFDCARVDLRPGYREAEDGAFSESDFPISVETLASLEEDACRIDLFVFDGFIFSEAQGRKLASFHPKIAFNYCSFADGGRSFFDGVGRNQGIKSLSLSSVSGLDTMSLIDALGKTTSLLKFDVQWMRGIFPQVVRSLVHNKSLASFHTILVDHFIPDQELLDMFEAVSDHPTLERLSFYYYPSSEQPTDNETRKKCTNAVLSMLQKNIGLQELRIECRNYDHPDCSGPLDAELIMREMEPYLQVNKYRGRVKELVEEPEAKFQRQVFSQALVCPEVNQTPNLMFMLLSGVHEQLPEVYKKEQESNVHAAKRPKKEE